MFFLWLVSLRLKNAGLVDLGWVTGLVGTEWIYFWKAQGFGPRKFLIFLMVSLWGLRLAAHLAARLARDPSEDARYQKIREAWKTRLNLKFLFFFLFQGVLVVVLSLPFLIASIHEANTLSIFEGLGLGIWVIAISGEALADAQLKCFKSDPAHKPKVCQAGLWNYSRHPNYFFEWLVWVSFFIFALGSRGGWMGVISPALMLYLLLFVSGVPAAELQSLRSRGEAYREYQRTTSVFVPWFKQE